MRRLSFTTVVTGIALVAILLAYMFSFQLRFNERAVRIRMGAADRDYVEKAGLYFRWPWPIEEIRKYDTRMQILDTPETELKTQDQQSLLVGCTAIWKIEDPKLFSQRLPGDSDANGYRKAQEYVRTRVNEARQSVIGRHTMSELFNLDAALVEKARDAMHEEMRAAIAPGLKDQFGIALVSVRIRRNTVPEGATQAILASMSAERTRLATRYAQEGRSTADTIRASATAARDKIMAFANRKAERVKSEGDRAAARVLEQVKSEDSELFIWLRYLDALENALKERSTIFIDSNSDLFKVFSAPLVTPDVPNPKPAKAE